MQLKLRMRGSCDVSHSVVDFVGFNSSMWYSWYSSLLPVLLTATTACKFFVASSLEYAGGQHPILEPGHWERSSRPPCPLAAPTGPMPSMRMHPTLPASPVAVQILIFTAILVATECLEPTPRADLQALIASGDPFRLPSGQPATYRGAAFERAGAGERWPLGVGFTLTAPRTEPVEARSPKSPQIPAAGPDGTALTGLGARGLAQEASPGVGDPEIPVSEETRVVDTRYPFSTVGQTGGGCTGVLVRRSCYMTAGHCVYDPVAGSVKGGLRFVPGRNGREEWRPHGSFKSVGWRVPNRWLTAGDARFDAAVVRLAEPVGETLG